MHTHQPLVVVLGATGYAGRYLTTRLHAAGYRIRAVVRDKPRALAPGPYASPSLAGCVDDWVVAPDATQLGASVMDDADHVVSALGVTRQKADPWNIDFGLNLHFLRLAEQRQVGSWLYLGVMHAAYGTSGLARAKHAFMEVLQRSPVPAHIVNPSGYFSDLTEVLRLAQRGVAAGVGNSNPRLSPIHGADLADFCVEKLTGPPGSWDVGGPEVLTYRQIVQLAFEAVGRRERYVRIPNAMVSSAVWLTDRASPRAAGLARFFLDNLQIDSIGVPYGTHTLREYFASCSR